MRIPFGRATLLTASIVIGSAVSDAGAQTHPATGVIDGIVTDTNLVSLAGANALIVGTKIRVTTGENGRFRVLGLTPGTYILVVNRAGYEPSTTNVELAVGDTLRVSILLEPAAAAVTPLAGGPKPRSPRLAEFDERIKRPYALFLTQADIQQRRASSAMDLLREIRGVRILGKFATSANVNIVLPTCPFQLWVDGVALLSRSLDGLPPTDALAGLEIFVSDGATPPPYRDTTGAACGAILAWSKDGPA